MRLFPFCLTSQFDPAKFATMLMAFSWMVPMPARTAEHTITCPAKLEAAAVQIVNPPEGWTPNVSSFFRLNTAAPMVGPPSRIGELKETQYKTSGKKSIYRWDFLDRDAYPEGKWLACKYGDDHKLVLSRRIDDDATQCTVTHTKAWPSPDKIEVKCYW